MIERRTFALAPYFRFYCKHLCSAKEKTAGLDGPAVSFEGKSRNKDWIAPALFLTFTVAGRAPYLRLSGIR
jgi:hypothetical protein